MPSFLSAATALSVTASLLLSLVGPAAALGATDTITWGGDNSRAGYQTTHNMDPSVVGSDQFAQIFQTKFPGNYGNQLEQIYSQPLVYTTPVDNVQYLYVSTTQNNVYKLDAKTGVIVASRNLHIPFLQADLDNCFDISPHIGIISTGVIDPATDTLYLTAKTYADQSQINKAQGRPNGRWYIHALDVNTLEEKPGFPLNLEGIVARNSNVRIFNGGVQHQRPALLQQGNYIYVGFGSHCVQYDYTGWVIGFHKTTGAIVERFATQGQGVDVKSRGASLWMSGGGIASDDKGSLFFATGNGYGNQLADTPVKGRTPPTSLEEAAVHMTINEDGSLNVVDFFMPYEKRDLDNADLDLGTSPLVMLPSEFSCGSVTRTGVVTGKTGKTYWINLDNMGGYKNGPAGRDDVISTFQNDNMVYAGAGVYPLEGGYVYINVIGYPTNVFKFSCDNNVPSWTKVAEAPDKNANALGVGHGTVTTLNGQPGTGLVWTSDTQSQTLKVYNAVPQNGKLTLIKSFSVVGVTKFTRPVFGNGIVYQGTRFGILYAYGAPTQSPLDCGGSAATNFGTGELGVASATKTFTCKASVDVSITSISLDDDANYVLSDVPTGSTTLRAGSSISFKAAFKPSKVGTQFANIIVATGNLTSYTSKTAIRLAGTGQSSKAMLTITPNVLNFKTMAVGSGTNQQSLVLANGGQASLTINSVKYSFSGSSGPFVNSIAPFNMTTVPNTIAANGQVVINIGFTPTEAKNYTLTVLIDTAIGQQTVTISASAGAAPVAKLEFQTPDGSGWVTYDGTQNLTFGTVLQGQTRTLIFRVSNVAAAGGVPLELGVSKPPLATDGNILGAANLVDLAEGTAIASGQSATAKLYCSPPSAFWNTDSYSRTVVWTMATNGLNFGKKFITFDCTATAPQAAPLAANGQGKYRFGGCYKEWNPARQLDKLLFSDTAKMTAALCLDACDKAGLPVCGLQYRQECWGGKTLPSERVNDADCEYVCTGDNSQSCGGNGAGPTATGTYITLFANNMTVPPPPAPVDTTPTKILTCPEDNGANYTNSDGATFQMVCYADIMQGDMGIVYVSSWTQCVDACARTSGCQALIWHPYPSSPCYLKKLFINPSKDNDIWAAKLITSNWTYTATTTAKVVSATTKPVASLTSGAVVATTSAPSDINGITCPASHNGTYTVGSKIFRMLCYTSSTPNDLGPVFVTSWSQCAAACAAKTGCAGFVWRPTTASSPCYLKGSWGPVTTDNTIWGAQVIGNASTSSVATISATTTGLSIGTGSATLSSSAGVSTTVSSSLAATTTAVPAVLICPDNDNGTYTASNGATFQMACYTDFAGHDFGAPVYVDTWVQCVEKCISIKSCVAFAWSANPDSPCYLKSGVGAPMQNSAIWGAKMIALPSSSSAVTVSATTVGSSSSTGSVSRSLTSSAGVSSSVTGSSSVLASSSGVLTSTVSSGVVTSTASSQGVTSTVSTRSSGTQSRSASTASVSASTAATSSTVIASSSTASSIGSSSTSVTGVVVGTSTSAGITASASSGSSTGTSAGTSSTTAQSTTSSATSSATSLPTISCPASDGMLYKSTGGVAFIVDCYADRTETDLTGGADAKSAPECAEACSNTSKCSSFAWNAATNGPCTLKQQSVSDVSNLWRARVVKLSADAPTPSSPTTSSRAASSTLVSSSSSSSVLSRSSSFSSSSIASTTSSAVVSSTSSSALSSSSPLSSSSSPSSSSSSSSSVASSSAALSTSTTAPKTSTSTPATSTTKAASTPSVIINPGFLGYDSIGCWSEATTGRALPNQVATTNKTVASCITACYGKYEYIGLEYFGNECWCGSNLKAAGVAQLDDSKCNRVCAGNSTEYCGGPKALNVYKATGYKPESQLQPKVGTWEVQGCYSDSAAARALSDKVSMADTMTLDSCAAFCDGSSYFGTEFGRECYCGSSIANVSTKSWNPNECNMSCKGNSTQTCGAQGRIQIYQNIAQGPSRRGVLW